MDADINQKKSHKYYYENGDRYDSYCVRGGKRYNNRDSHDSKQIYQSKKIFEQRERKSPSNFGFNTRYVQDNYNPNCRGGYNKYNPQKSRSNERRRYSRSRQRFNLKHHREDNRPNQFRNFNRQRQDNRVDYKEYSKKYLNNRNDSLSPQRNKATYFNKKYHINKQSRSDSLCKHRVFHKRHEIHKRDHNLHRKHSFKDENYRKRQNSYPNPKEKKSSSKRKRKSYSYSSSSSSSSSNSSQKDLDHYKYKIGTVLNGKYKIEQFLGDGTFGRVLECTNLHDGQNYAVKVIRPVKRYIESAKIEAETIIDIITKDVNRESHCVLMIDYFYFEDQSNRYIALVFEKLGKSLYDFIKMNKYRGFPIHIIQDFARQIFQGIGFLHEKLELTHTDLKPENLLFKNSIYDAVKYREHWPKKEKRNRSVSPSTRSYSKDPKEKEDPYFIPLHTNIKIIDFGGATYKNERHSDIINTRQYRSPEVILGCCEWDEKSDVWSIACILVELYTGELFFPTHNNEEHLCLIEKISGPIPHWMADNCRKEFAKIFYFDKPDSEINKIGHRINFNKLGKREERLEAVSDLETIDDLILDEHLIFKQFLKSLFVIDPTERPSCKECLKHQFFKSEFNK